MRVPILPRAAALATPLVLVPAALLLVVTAGIVLGTSRPDDRLRYRDLPVVELPVPPAGAKGAGPARRVVPPADPAPPAIGPEPAAAKAPPVIVDAAMQEAGPFGPLPRVATDGRRAFTHYRRAAEGPTGPRLAVVFVGLGLSRAPSLTAVELPPELGLGYSPYAFDAAGWQAHARWRGHETFLEIPVEPVTYPVDDPGPRLLRPSLPADENRSRLLWLLARGAGYPAVVLAAGRFREKPDAMLPLARELAARGLGLIELGGAGLAEVAERTGLPYAAAVGPLDGEPTPAAIDLALGDLEARALRGGRALGFVHPLPVTMARLSAWAPSLPGKGIALVPPSRIFER